MVLSISNIAFFLIIVAYVQTNETSNLNLYPQKPITDLEFKQGEKIYFNVQGLKPNSNYEIKISYPATFPTKFTLDLLYKCACKKCLDSNSILNEDVCICDTKKKPSSRQLLDIEKVMFETDGNSKIMGINSCCCENSNECKTCSPIISVEGVYNSISHLEYVEQRNIPFDIVLEPLVVKVIPITAISLIICGVILIIISIFITKRLLPYFTQPKNKTI